MLIACLSTTKAADAQVLTATAPADSPAGRQFTAWLQAFNSGKRETLRLFIEGHFAKDPVDAPSIGGDRVDQITDQQSQLFAKTRGYDVRKITVSSSSITALVQARWTGHWTALEIYVTAQPPHLIEGFGLRDIEAPVEFLPPERLNSSQIRGKVETLLTSLVAADAFSGTVLVAKNGRPLYAKAYGLANRAWNQPNRINTKFNLASLSKMFTAVAIAQLVEQGKLSYQDTVGKILPTYPNQRVAQEVTVHQLLTHTSGLMSAGASTDKMLASQRQGFRSVADYLTTFVHDPLEGKPGGQFSYSNNGYILLGTVIEAVSGQSYDDYVRQHIYQPAGMAHSAAYELDTDPPNLATGYMDAPDKSRRSNLFFLGLKGTPAGGSYSTIEDLLKFEVALRNHRLLNAKSLAILWAGQVNSSGQDAQYGYGFVVKRYNDTRIIGHTGGWFGANTHIDIYPDLGYTVVLLANYDAPTTAIAHRLREWLTQGHQPRLR